MMNYAWMSLYVQKLEKRVEELSYETLELTGKLETVTLEVNELKRQLESETGTGHRDEYFVHDHLASSNS